MSGSLAMVLERVGGPLVPRRRPVAEPGPGEALVRVEACGVCRTDLHVVDGELPGAVLPVVPGHEVVGRLEAVGQGVDLAPGARVGIPWLGATCGACPYCRMGWENLCDAPAFTGHTRDGGYAEHVSARAAFLLPLPEGDPAALAPLLCAGLIGHRALRMAGDARRIGLYGFGAAAHIVAQVAIHEGREILALTRPGDEAAQGFARSLGAAWAGPSDEAPPAELDAAILFAPVGALVPLALRAVRKGGTVVCAGIHMSDVPGFPYADLWGERVLRSVANLTREDGRAFLPLAQAAGVRTHPVRYPLAQADRALADLRSGAFQGAAVLIP
jgi:propanol-preferring alcohol dehydrogenase